MIFSGHLWFHYMMKVRSDDDDDEDRMIHDDDEDNFDEDSVDDPDVGDDNDHDGRGGGEYRNIGGGRRLGQVFLRFFAFYL